MNRLLWDGLTNGATSIRWRNFSAHGKKMHKKRPKCSALKSFAMNSTCVVFCSAQCDTWSSLHKFVETRCMRGAWRRESLLKSSQKLRRCRHNKSSLRRLSRNSRKNIGSSWERKLSWRTSAIRHTFVVWQPSQTRLLRCLTQLSMISIRAWDSPDTTAPTFWISWSSSKVNQPKYNKQSQWLRLLMDRQCLHYLYTQVQILLKGTWLFQKLSKLPARCSQSRVLVADFTVSLLKTHIKYFKLCFALIYLFVFLYLS